MAFHPVLPLLSALLVAAAPASGAEPAGHVVFARGAVSAESADGTVQVIGKDTPLFEGDVLTTGPRSFTVIELTDGTRMSLRPNTVFEVERYRDTAGAESAIMRLFKGGLRTITGYISKRDPEAYKLRTAVATIGIRGTEFDARLCAEDCQAEAEKLQASGEREIKVVGRVAFARGDLRAANAQGRPRTAVTGAPLYEGDTLTTGAGAHAVLAFRDDSRITLAADSSFVIETARFGRDDPAEGSQAFRLLRGGLRAVTGLLARRRPDAVRFHTPVATIGIRGTGFDLLCLGDCAAAPQAARPSPVRALAGGLVGALVPVAQAQAPANGLYARVWQGEILVQFGTQREVVPAGRIGLFDPAGARFRFVDRLPFELPVPRPDQVPIDVQKMFETRAKEQIDPGLYVSCITGHCSVEDLELGDGEAAWTGGEGVEPERIEPPAVLEQDPYFKAADPEVAPVLEVIEVGTDDGLECTF